MRAGVPLSLAAVVVPLCVGCGGGSTTVVEPETPDTQKVEVESATSPTDTVEVETSGDTDSAEVEVDAD